MKTTIGPSIDHRSRVGAERRERTRSRLVESALRVFTEHGVQAGTIDRVIRTAEVSRGTFYNYFRTDEDLYGAVAAEVGDELIRIVNPLVLPFTDPAARVACGIRLVIGLARGNRVLAEFLVRGGPGALRHGLMIEQVVLRDIALGIDSGAFSVRDTRLALDLLLGPVSQAFHTVLGDDFPEDYAQGLAQGVLQALGVPQSKAARLCAATLDEAVIPADSLFCRAGDRMAR